MIVTKTKRLISLKNIFHFERTFEKYCILIKKFKNQDRAFFRGVQSQRAIFLPFNIPFLHNF